jgi:hypothetical protein
MHIIPVLSREKLHKDLLNPVPKFVHFAHLTFNKKFDTMYLQGKEREVIKMLIYTWNEISDTKLGEVDNGAYNRVYHNLVKQLGFSIAERLIIKMWNRTLWDLLNASGVDCLDGFKII